MLGKAEDVKVFHEPDESYWVDSVPPVARSTDDLAGSKITSECLVLESTDPEGEFRVVLPRTDGIERASIEHAVVAGEDRFLITHNGSVNGWGTEGEKAVRTSLFAEAPVKIHSIMHSGSASGATSESRTSTPREPPDLHLPPSLQALTRMAIWP